MQQISVHSLPVAKELISFRGSPGTLDRAERLAEHIESQTGLEGLGISRGKILAMALERGLAQLEEEHGVSASKKKRGRK